MTNTVRGRVPRVLIRSMALAYLLASGGCHYASPPVNPNDPEITAAIEKVVAVAREGAATANAEEALSVTTMDDDFTFLTGDTLIAGYDQALATFRDTYSMLRSQTSDVISSRVRVLAPDVVLVTAVTQGTYTDKAGFTSDPVGLGSTIIFVRKNGEWRAVHYHQSIAK